MHWLYFVENVVKNITGSAPPPPSLISLVRQTCFSLNKLFLLHHSYVMIFWLFQISTPPPPCLFLWLERFFTLNCSMTSINVCNFIIFWLVLFSDCCLPAIWFLCWLVGSWCSHLWDVSWAGQLHPTSYWILNLPNRFNSRLLIKWIIQCILKQLLAGWVVYQTKRAFQKSELAGRTVTGPVILTKQ